MHMPKNAFLKSVSVVTLVAFSTGCASTTVIKTNPSGAKVFVDGAPVGKTPYSMTDTKTIVSTTSLRLEKPGYESITVNINRMEEPDIGPIIGGVCAGATLLGLAFFLWAGKYRAEHIYDLERKGGGTVPTPATPDTM